MPEYCPECSSEVTIVKDADWEQNQIVHTFPVDDKVAKVLSRYKVPFQCKICGSLKFPYQATLDRVFIFPDPPPEQVGAIYIPEVLRDIHQKEYGIALSVGPGHVNERRRFIPTSVKIGDRVVYDRYTPRRISVEGSDGKLYDITIAGEQDIHGTIEDKDNG
jgi:co-chaperonin GroES (HSP10)